MKIVHRWKSSDLLRERLHVLHQQLKSETINLGPKQISSGKFIPPMKQTIHPILDQFREETTSNRDLGDRFERLIYRFLELDPIYVEGFSRVWMWNEFPRKGNVGDVGIDLVGEERATGEFCAIQCKFYMPDHTLSMADLDSFFTPSGKTLSTACIIVSTTDKWGRTRSTRRHIIRSPSCAFRAGSRRKPGRLVEVQPQGPTRLRPPRVEKFITTTNHS